MRATTSKSPPRGLSTSASPSLRSWPADQREVRVGVGDHDGVRAGRDRGGQERAQGGKAPGSPRRQRTALARRRRFLRGPESEHRGLHGAAERAREHGPDRDPERPDHLAEGPRVFTPPVGQIALGRAVVDARHALVVLAVIGVGVAEVEDVAAGAKGGEELGAAEGRRGRRLADGDGRRAHREDDGQPRRRGGDPAKRPPRASASCRSTRVDAGGSDAAAGTPPLTAAAGRSGCTASAPSSRPGTPAWRRHPTPRAR